MGSTNNMFRLTTFFILLATTLAQNGYEYNKPGKPFNQGSQPNRPGFPVRPTDNGYPLSPTSASYPNQQSDIYPNGGPGSTPDYSSGPSNFPSGGGNQNYPVNNQPPQIGYPGNSNIGSSSPGSNTPVFGPNVPAFGAGSPGFGQGSPTFGPSSPGFRPGSKIPGFGPGSPGFGVDDTGAYEAGDYSAIPGEPDKDYPILAVIPETSFRCNAQPYPGYYADVETRCQVFHVCANNITYDFLCPNGTIFSQEFFVCVWWNQFDCNSAPNFYELNANLYDYSIIGSNSFAGVTDISQQQIPSYPGSSGLQGASNYPGNPSTSPGIQTPGGSLGYPGSTGPSSSYPNAPQGPSPSYPSGPQGPSSNYPGTQGSQGQFSPSGPHGPTGTYPNQQSIGSSLPVQSPSSYPNQQGPSYPGQQGLSPTYPGQQGGSQSYPGNSGYPTSTASLNQIGSQGYPGSQGQSNYPGGNQGYPSGRPSGPSFPTGIGADLHGTQGDRYPAQKPNREYLPPINQ